MTEMAAPLPVTRAAPSLPRRLLIATPTGWAIGIIAGIALIVLTESLGLQNVQTPLVVGVALGLSARQYHALRPVLVASRVHWILVSCLGLSVPFILSDVATLAGRTPTYDIAVYIILGGSIASALQWSVLKATVLRAGGWLVASTAGYVAAASTMWLNDRVLPKTPGIAGALQYLGVILAGGVLFGVFTAVAASRFQLRPGDDGPWVV